jgi:uncharacterized protein YhbP (UPF0306 family)
MSADSGPDVPQHVLDYIGEQRTLTLATASPAGVPHAATLLYVNHGQILYVWTGANSLIARHVEHNPRVSFTIDDQVDDPSTTRGVQGRGECRVVLGGEEIARAAMLFGDKFPTLASGRSTAGISFFRITPSEVKFIDNTVVSADRGADEFGAVYHGELVYSVFGGLPMNEAVTLTGELQRMSADAGEVIVRQGGPADKFFVIVDGEVEVVREEDGRSETLATLGSGQFFGEMAIMYDQPRAATVRAVRPTLLLAMDRDSFRSVVAGSLGTSDDFDRVLRERLGVGGPS